MPARDHPDEESEWAAERIGSWVETYKKAMLTPVILAVVRELQPVSVARLAGRVNEMTGWQITESGLYRTLRRLQTQGILASSEVEARRTGARRKSITLTDLGNHLLTGIADALIDLR